MFKPFKVFYSFLFVALILFSVATYLLLSPVSGQKGTVVFTVNKGQKLTDIAVNLEKAGLLKSYFVFRGYVYLRGWSKRIQSGEYNIPGNSNILMLAEMLTYGPESPAEKTIVIKEGWNNREIGDYLESLGFGSRRDFLREASRTGWQTKYSFFDDKPLNVDIEGYLFPDTYRIYNKSTVQNIIVKMLDNLDDRLTPVLRADIKKHGRDIHEVLTVASILEKEVSSDIDRRKVADIFYKRIKLGIPLQADSTVNYVTGKGNSRSLLTDTAIDSLYNTYKYRGLPPGPICSPSLSAIMAAIYPESNPYLYFLTSKDGTVYYGRTFEEHKRNRVNL